MLCWNTDYSKFSAEQLVDCATKMGDPQLFSQFLKCYMSKCKACSPALNFKFIDRIQLLLSHRNENYQALALDFMETVVRSLDNSLLCRSSDTHASFDTSERCFDERSARCRNALIQIRLNSIFFTDKLNKQKQNRFEDILSSIDQLIPRAH